MLEQNLIKQLSQLKEIKPDVDWKIRNRDILVKQIYGSQVEQNIGKNSWTWCWRLPLTCVSSVSQPAWVAIMIFLFLVSGGTASVKMADRTKPGDPLYIAKLISERAQLALTFNNESKARLGLEFANNRVAEINQFLAEPAGPNKDQNVNNLLSNLKSQISDVKSSIAKISPAATQTNNPTNADNKDDGAGQMVISTDLKKDKQGIEISDGPATAANDQAAPKPEQATTTVNNSVAAASSTSALNIAQTADILKEAGKLLDEEKYNDTLIKLDELDKSMKPVPEPEDDKNATSTAE